MTTLINNGAPQPRRYSRHSTHVLHQRAAGIAGKVYTIEEQPLEEWNLVNSINGSGPFLGMKTASDALHKAGSGASVVNVASMFAISGGLGNVPAYHGTPPKIRPTLDQVAHSLAMLQRRREP